MFHRASLVSVVGADANVEVRVDAEVGADVEVGADGKNERSTPNELSTTPEMTLLADPAMTSTPCSTRPRRLPGTSTGASGGSAVRTIGIGVRSAVL
jgi:hypothetical protein